MNKIIQQNPPQNNNFFKNLLAKGKEGVFILIDSFCWKAALSRDFMITLRHLISSDIPPSFPDWENLCNIYLLNWNNNVIINDGLSERDARLCRNQFIYWFFLARDRGDLNNWITRFDQFWENNPDASGVYIEQNYQQTIPLLRPWNDQIVISDC